jgi:BirA family biotin operon repressor/biotin-[acetyl-CoA-carboxylase] ligase
VGAAELARALEARGARALPAVEWVEELVSTSDRLKAHARVGAPEWTVVVADRQTGGRGREGRRWSSPVGGLYLSVLLRPRFATVSLVPLAAGVAVAEAVGEWGVAARLKWPNDVLVDGRKLAGVLAEAASSASGVEWLALGIGVNATTDRTSLPAELREATAILREVAEAVPTPADLAAAVLTHLRVCYDALSVDPRSVVEAWRARAVEWWGERVEIRTANETFRARARGVDGEGALLVELEDGRERRVLSGELRRLRLAGEP